MKIYLISLFGSVTLAYLAERMPHDNNGRKLNKFFVTILILYLSFISGFRYMNYYLCDEYNYRVAVDAVRGLPFFDTFKENGEWVYDILNWVCANFFHSNQAFIFITSVIINVLIVCFFAKYARPFWFAVFMYICGGFYFTSMNVVRQYVAVAIILWCYPLAQERKLLKYIMVTFLAAGFHMSALIMLPLYFVFRKKIDISLLVVLVLSVIVLLNFEEVMMVILPNTIYDSYLQNILSSGYGVKLIRIVVWLVPYTIIVLNRNKMIRYLGIPDNVVYATGIAIGVSIMSYAYVYVARIDVYFTIISICAIIKIPELFAKDSRKLVQIAMIILFFAFGSYQMMISPTYHNMLFESISGVL